MTGVITLLITLLIGIFHPMYNWWRGLSCILNLPFGHLWGGEIEPITWDVEKLQKSWDSNWATVDGKIPANPQNGRYPSLCVLLGFTFVSLGLGQRIFSSNTKVTRMVSLISRCWLEILRCRRCPWRRRKKKSRGGNKDLNEGICRVYGVNGVEVEMSWICYIVIDVLHGGV